jgi:hypothetical protein
MRRKLTVVITNVNICWVPSQATHFLLPQPSVLLGVIDDRFAQLAKAWLTKGTTDLDRLASPSG